MKMLLFLYVFFITMISVSELQAQILNVDEQDKVEFMEKEPCEELLEKFANVSASFTYCAVKYARPIRICERCVSYHEDVIAAHEAILKVEDEKGNKFCKERLMNLDRLDVIEGGFTSVTDLWSRADCQYCFSFINSTVAEISNSSKQFLDMHTDANKCISQHYLGNGTYNSSVCSDCEKKYCDLNKFYDEIKVKQDSVCMDIVDSMNITRMLWSSTLPCLKDDPKMDVTLLASSCIILALPFFFYLSAALFTTEVRNRLQMQKRLLQILKPSTSAET